MKMTDEELKDFIKKRVLVSLPQVVEELGYYPNHINARLRGIEGIGNFSLVIGMTCGSLKRGAAGLFDGFSKKLRESNRCFYHFDNEDAVAKILGERLGLSPSMASGRKHRLTTHLSDCLPPSLFDKLYRQYYRRRNHNFNLIKYSEEKEGKRVGEFEKRLSEGGTSYRITVPKIIAETDSWIAESSIFKILEEARKDLWKALKEGRIEEGLGRWFGFTTKQLEGGE